jgi:hypothetical protein
VRLRSFAIGGYLDVGFAAAAGNDDAGLHACLIPNSTVISPGGSGIAQGADDYVGQWPEPLERGLHCAIGNGKDLSWPRRLDYTVQLLVHLDDDRITVSRGDRHEAGHRLP